MDKKSSLDALRPLPYSAMYRLQKDLNTEWTYNSNSIEGNSLTLRETRIILEDGLTIGGKPLREHFEAINHAQAIQKLMDFVALSPSVRSADILDLHAMIMRNIDEEFAGRIRNGAVRISGANFLPPSSATVSDLLDELVDWVNRNPQKLDAISLSAVFHQRFVWIHPFFDGNGRTVRLAMNLILIQQGFPPAFILRNDHKKYYAALNAANNGHYDKILLMMAQAAERSLNLYLNAADDSGEEYQPISNIAREPGVPYGQEYISLLARRGKIDAYKEGRVWYTRKSAVLRHAE